MRANGARSGLTADRLTATVDVVEPLMSGTVAHRVCTMGVPGGVVVVVPLASPVSEVVYATMLYSAATESGACAAMREPLASTRCSIGGG